MRKTTILALLLASSLVSAQESRVVLRNIPVQQRGPGVEVSPSVTVASDATGIVRVIADIPAADYADTQNSMVLRLYQLNPSLQTWTLIAGTNWIGGNRTDPELGVNPMPYVSLDIAPYKGRDLRLEVDLPRRMRVGGQIDLGSTWPTDPHP